MLWSKASVPMNAMGTFDKFETYYSILGVNCIASMEEISKAYRRLSLQVHPDKGGNHEDFLRLKKAHDVLMDPQLRQKYDKYGEALVPSPGDLIGSGTIGRLVPLSMSATGGIACQFLRVTGAFSATWWGLGCAITAGGSWYRVRGSNSRADTALPAILGGLVLGNVTGLVLGLGARGTARWLLKR